uniref:Intraflagellar transport protein 46 homolog n=1 Tax=Meloidogyne javanica TaxID=6303 RepID=A0A915LWY7_MELJA
MNINESQEEESLVVVDTNNQQQQQGSSHFGEGQQEVTWSMPRLVCYFNAAIFGRLFKENPQQQLPPQSPPIPTHARNLFPESLQNRQFNSSQILNDESCSNSIIEEDRQQHVRDVQRSPTISNRSSPVGGYPIDYSADPPPYTSSPPRVGGRLFVGNRLNTNLATVPVSERLSEREGEKSDEGTEHEEDHDEPEEDHEDEQESSGAYTVPSPSLTVEDGNKPPPPTLVNSSSSNFREALGNSVSMAGGVAAAVIASRGATMSTASPRYQSDSASASPRPVLIEGARTVASLVTSSNRIPSIPQPEYPQTSPREQQKREPAITTPTSNVRNIQQQQQRHPPNAELKALFSLTESYIAERIDIEPTLKPFQIDYVPAVGDVDPFIKVPRQDEIQAMGADWLWTGLMAVHPNEDLQLGLTVLDEPAAIQSDPAIVDLRLHQLSGKSGASVDAPVKKLSRADKNTKQIDRWIQSVKELRRTKPPDRVHYGKPMPSIESLMQEWPQSVEQNLKGMKVGGSRQGFNNGNDDDLEITEQLLLNNTSSTIDHLVVDDDGEIK